MRILEEVIRLIEHDAGVPPEQKAWFENTGSAVHVANNRVVASGTYGVTFRGSREKLDLPQGDDPVSTIIRENLKHDPHYYDEPPPDTSKGTWI